jgi:hypothetical protein
MFSVFNHKTILIPAKDMSRPSYVCDDIDTQKPVCTLERDKGILGLILLGHSGELMAEGDEFR